MRGIEPGRRTGVTGGALPFVTCQEGEQTFQISRADHPRIGGVPEILR